MNGVELLKPEDVAELLKVSLGTVYRLVREHEIEAFRIRSAVRFHREQVERYLERVQTRVEP